MAVEHTCDDRNCKREATECFCEQDLELMKQDHYAEGKKDGHKEGYEEGYAKAQEDAESGAEPM